ncbi:MAG: hypothetical protein Q4D58_08005 [Synergistaceae bacterium]|nr:hypothetical protein [Synergistaceae bacterium]
MSWRGWRQTPLRKPLPVLCVLFTFCVIIACLIQDKDVPPNIMYLLAAIDGVSVGGYMGSSAYESRYGDGSTANSYMSECTDYDDDEKEATH